MVLRGLVRQDVGMGFGREFGRGFGSVVDLWGWSLRSQHRSLESLWDELFAPSDSEPGEEFRAHMLWPGLLVEAKLIRWIEENNDLRNQVEQLEQQLTEARTETEQLLSEARARADTVGNEARNQAEAILDEALTRAGTLEREAREKAWSLERDAQRKHTEVLSVVTQEKNNLEERIDALRTFEREYRSRLMTHLESLRRELTDRGAAARSEEDRYRASIRRTMP